MTDIRKDLETAAVAMADFEGGSIFRETLLNAIAALDAIELAYGLLWRCAVDRRTADGRRIYLAARRYSASSTATARPAASTRRRR
jgi:hypothetical protein